MQGIIQRIIKERNYGFIEVEGEENNIFFHRTGVAEDVDFDDLHDGDEVEFEVEDTNRGPQAMNLVKL